MIPGGHAIGIYAIGQVPPDLSAAAADPYRRLLADPEASLVYLMQARPRDADAVRPLIGWPQPLGGGPVAGSTTLRGASVPVYLASRSYRTTPSESPANTLFDGALDQPHSMEMRLFDGVDPLSQATAGWGNIVALDGEGELDELTRYDWDGAPVEVLVGAANYPLRDFATAVRADGAGLSWAAGQLVIHLRSRLARLSRPATRRIYAGTGGIEGSADLAGMVAPLAYGRVRHAPLRLLDTARQLYQAHDGRIQAVDATYDKALALTAGSDYPTAAALLAATVPAGTYATCLAEGYVRLGSPATGIVTADLRGDVTDGVYVETPAALVRRICLTRLGDVAMSDADLVLGDFAVLDQSRGWPTGLYALDDVTVDSLVTEALAAGGAKHVASRDGRLRLHALGPLDEARAVLGPADIDEAGISVDATAAPVWRVRIGWGRLWQVFTDNDIGGRISDTAERARLRQEYRWAVASSDRIRARHSAATELTVQTNLATEAEAEQLASALLSLCGLGAARYTVPIRQHPFVYQLGDVVVINTRRTWRGAGRPLLVVGLTEDAKTAGNALELYG